MKDEYVSPGPSGGPGMELRDLFAAHAMQGLLAHHGVEEASAPDIAAAAYGTAETMLRMRKKTLEQIIEGLREEVGEEEKEDTND